MKDRRYEPDVVAFHEAGHAVACCVLNVLMWEKRAVSIVPNGDSLGRVNHHRDWLMEKGRSLSTMALCGPIAEDIYLGDFGETIISGVDAKNVLLLSQELLRGCNSISDVQKHPYFSELYEAEWAIAKILLLENWEAVRLVAAALLEKKTLDRQEVLDLYRSTLKSERMTLPLSKVTA